ncbi:RTA1 like protein-domain-containing protein [Aspergillus spectabilis]
MSAAICFIIAFGISSAIYIRQAYRYRARFMIPFIIVAILEALGYAARMVSATQSPNWSVGLYAMQSLLLLLAPPLLAASIYMILSRIIVLVECEKMVFLHPRRLMKDFTTGNMLSFLIRSAGGAILSQSKTAMPSWGTILFVHYTVSILIMVRSIYRVVQYIEGHEWYLQSYTAFLYIFDAALMWIICGVLRWEYPWDVFVGKCEREVGSGDGEEGIWAYDVSL